MGLDPFHHPGDALAHAVGVDLAAAAVVADVDDEPLGAAVDPRGRPGGLGMADDVGQRLLDDPVGRRGDALRDGLDVAGDVAVDRQAAFADVVDQRRDVDQGEGRAQLGLLPLPQRYEGRAQVVEGAGGGVADGPQVLDDAGRGVGPLLEDVEGHAGVHADHGQAVADDVVDLPGHRHAFVGAVPVALGLGGLGAGVAGLAGDDAADGGDREVDEADGDVHHEAVRVVDHEFVEERERDHEPPEQEQARLQGAGHDIGEHRHRGQQVDRSFGVAHGHEVPQRERGAEQRRLRPDAAHRQHRRAQPDQRQRAAAGVVPVVGAERRPRDEEPQDEGDADVGQDAQQRRAELVSLHVHVVQRTDGRRRRRRSGAVCGRTRLSVWVCARAGGSACPCP